MADYFPSAEDDTSTSASQSEASDTNEKDTGEEDGEYETFLAPKSAFGELNPGDKETVECVHSYEDEYELRCTKDKGSKKSTMDEAMEGMGKMTNG